MESLIRFLAKLLGWKDEDLDLMAPQAPKPPPEAPKPPEKPITPPTPVKPVTEHPNARQKLYDTAYGCLGKHMGLDTTVPKEVNCANALSHVLIKAAVKGLPAKGIASTAKLYEWLRAHFEAVQAPLEGDVVIYPTGHGNGSLLNGHAFIKGKFQMMSNNSNTGLWDNHWKNLAEADAFYTGKGGIPRYSFRWKG